MRASGLGWSDKYTCLGREYAKWSLAGTMMYDNSLELLLNPQQKNKTSKKFRGWKETNPTQRRMIPSLSRIHWSSPHIDLINQDWVKLRKKKQIRLSSYQFKSKAVYESNESQNHQGFSFEASWSKILNKARRVSFCKLRLPQWRLHSEWHVVIPEKKKVPFLVAKQLQKWKLNVPGKFKCVSVRVMSGAGVKFYWKS